MWTMMSVSPGAKPVMSLPRSDRTTWGENSGSGVECKSEISLQSPSIHTWLQSSLNWTCSARPGLWPY